MNLLSGKLATALLLLTLFNQAFTQCESPSSCLNELDEINFSIEEDSGCQNQPQDHLEETHFALVTNEKQKAELDPDSWKYALGGTLIAPGAFILGTVIHEGTHCLAAEKLPGLGCAELIIFPTYDQEKDYLYFGYTKFETSPENPPEYKDYVKAIAAPMFVNASLISIYSTLAFTNKLPKNKWAKTAIFVLGATQVIDMTNHARNFSPYSDSNSVMAYLQVEKDMSVEEVILAVKGPQIGFSLLGASALAVEGYRIFTKQPEKNEMPIQIVPSLTTSGLSIQAHGQF